MSLPSSITCRAVLVTVFFLLCGPMALNASVTHEPELDMEALTRLLQSLPSPRELKERTGVLGGAINGAQGIASALTSQVEQGAANVLGGLHIPTFNGIGSLAANAGDQISKFVSDPLGFMGAGPLSPALKQTLADPANAAEVAAVLSVVAPSFLLASSIMFTVSNGIATTANSLALIPSGLGTVVGPINWLLDVQSFGLKLGNDRRAALKDIDGTFFNQWSGAVKAVAGGLATLSDGPVLSSLTRFSQDVAAVEGIIAAVAQNPLIAGLSG